MSDPFDFVRHIHSEIGSTDWNWSPEVKTNCVCGHSWIYHWLAAPHKCNDCVACNGYEVRKVPLGIEMNSLTEKLYRRWQQGAGTGGMFDDCFKCLVKAYSEPGRCYHTLQHLEQCFDVMDRLVPIKANTERNHEHTVLSLAIWFHDFQYSQLAKDNEEWSVQSFLAWADVIDWDRSVKDEVSRAIMLTKHDDSLEVASEVEAYLLDVDLSILGSPPEAFAEYERKIREEYRMIPDEQYVPARKKILERFASKPSVYLTKPFKDALEWQAGGNLRIAIGGL